MDFTWRVSDCEELVGVTQYLYVVFFSCGQHLLLQKEIYLKLDKNQYQKYIQLPKVKKCGWFNDKLSLLKY